MTSDEQARRVAFIDTLNANIDNNRLSDSEFRQFVKNSLTQFDFGSKASSSSGMDHYGPYGQGVAQR